MVRHLTLKVDNGGRVAKNLDEFLRKNGVAEGIIPCFIGASDWLKISAMRDGVAGKLPFDEVMEISEQLELTGNGRISQGKAHIHITAARRGCATVGGHFHDAMAKSHFIIVEILAFG